MPALGLQPDVVTRGSMACALGRGALWRLAVRFRAGSAALGGAIITACASAVQWSWSQEVLGALRRDSEARLQICRGAVLAALARSSRWELACAELQEMWSRVPQEAAPDIRAYNVVISACELSGRWRQALLLLKAARSNKLESDEVSHAAVASACTRRGLAWAFALWMLEVHSGPRDAVLLTTALTACEVGQRWHSAMKLHQAFKGFGLEADEAANLAAAGACQRAACWLQALSYLTPSVSVGNAAIAACRSHWQQGLFLFARMPERDVLSSETQLATQHQPTSHGSGSNGIGCTNQEALSFLGLAGLAASGCKDSGAAAYADSQALATNGVIREVPCLTAGLPTPDSVAAQKEAFAAELEQELRDGVAELSAKFRTMTDELHSNANEQRNQYNLTLETSAKEQEEMLEKQHAAQLRQLREAAMRQVAELEHQAELLVRARQMQEGREYTLRAAPFSSRRPSLAQVPVPGSLAVSAPGSVYLPAGSRSGYAMARVRSEASEGFAHAAAAAQASAIASHSPVMRRSQTMRAVGSVPSFRALSFQPGSLQVPVSHSFSYSSMSRDMHHPPLHISSFSARTGKVEVAGSLR
ncbi:unnamed protein product [Effrenium voratum]|nr:unnamed protein product [Effrenium voratum]